MTERKTVTVIPTTRIEGHGKVVITLDESGNVSDASFFATEIRGFDHFLRGMDAERLPFIISRICGVCSTAHVLASVKAIESIYRTEITETARKLRELLLMGQIISNHSLVFFFLILPDFWFSLDEDPKKRNIFQIMRENPEIGRKGMAVRRFGTHINEAVGKREVHVVSTVPGGLINPLTERERQELLKEATTACSTTREAFDLGKELFEKNWPDFSKAGDYKTYYMAMSKDDAVEFYDGQIRVQSPNGETLSEFHSKDYMAHVEEKRPEWTYAKLAYLKSLGWPKGIVQVGPTARLNINKRATTPFANRELKEFKSKYGEPAHATLLFDLSRLIDLMYACERAGELLEDESITRADTRVKVEPRGGTGTGVVEAPRGTLAHEYVLTRKGTLKNMKLIIPTQINYAAINLNLRDAAGKFIQHGEVKPGLLNKVEMVIRAYDPCIKCAARLNEEGTKVEIRDKYGKLLRAF